MGLFEEYGKNQNILGTKNA